MLVDVDWYVRIMQVVRDNKGKLKVATLTHFWVEWLGHPGDIPVAYPGTWGIQCCPRRSRGTRVIILWNATQAQRDHKIIHARNFHVQPNAIMGSGIVE